MKKSNITLTILKKELKYFFGDKRIFFSVVILPGLLLFMLCAMIGIGISNLSDTDNKVYNAVVENAPKSLSTILYSNKFNITKIDSSQENIEQIGEEINSGKYDVFIKFTEKFDELVSAYTISSKAEAPNVEVFYFSSVSNSSEAYALVTDLLSKYEDKISNKFDINNSEKSYDLCGEKYSTAYYFSIIMPVVLIVFIFSACASITPESIAGQKERGTISSMMVAPINRKCLAMGKILSLTIVAILSALASFLGMVCSAPFMLGDIEKKISINIYTFPEYVMMILIIISTVLLLVSFLAIISTASRSVKEANSYTSPTLILSSLVGVLSMLGVSANGKAYMFLIPIFNSSQSLTTLFALKYNLMDIVITIVANMTYALVIAFFLTKMFDLERIMLNK